MSEREIKKIQQDVKNIQSKAELKIKEKSEAEVRLSVVMELLQKKFDISSLSKARKEIDVFDEELEEITGLCTDMREELETKVKEFDSNL